MHLDYTTSQKDKIKLLMKSKANGRNVILEK